MSDARRSKAEYGASSGRGDFDGPRPDSHAATVADAPFITTTTYSVWMRLAGQQEWRCYSDGFTEHHHAVEDAERVQRGVAQHIVGPRETRVARRTTVIEWVDE